MRIKVSKGKTVFEGFNDQSQNTDSRSKKIISTQTPLIGDNFMKSISRSEKNVFEGSNDQSQNTDSRSKKTISTKTPLLGDNFMKINISK